MITSCDYIWFIFHLVYKYNVFELLVSVLQWVNCLVRSRKSFPESGQRKSKIPKIYTDWKSQLLKDSWKHHDVSMVFELEKNIDPQGPQTSLTTIIFSLFHLLWICSRIISMFIILFRISGLKEVVRFTLKIFTIRD